MKKTALLLIDIQNDYFPGGRMELVGSDEAAEHASRLLNAARQAGLHTFLIQHISTRPGATFFLPDTAGVQLHESIQPTGADVIITKHFPNSFRETSLLEKLQNSGIRRLIIGGMMTHLCVDTTVRAAFDLGFQSILAHQTCATRDLEWQGQILPAEQVHHSFIASLNGMFTVAMETTRIFKNMAS